MAWLLLFAGPGALAEVYRETGADGVPVFSDRRTPAAEPVEIRAPNVIAAPPAQQPQTGAEPLPPATPPTRYEVAITSPENDSAIRENSGALTLTLAISPDLAPGHRAELIMDGEKIQDVTGSGPVALTNLDRGGHSFTVRVLDERGKVLGEAAPVTITLLRYARPRPEPAPASSLETESGSHKGDISARG